MMIKRNYIKDALLGIAVGDALGVPVEFLSRSVLDKNPVTGIIGYGTHHQPEGTWSDDSALTFCLAEMLCGEYDLQNLANRFINWKNFSYWTPHGEVFDIGIATSQAISRLEKLIPPTDAGGKDEGSNGNGSLMRILPLLFHIQYMPAEDRYRSIEEVSSLTHAHTRSIIACFIYLEFALGILNGLPVTEAYQKTCNYINTFLADKIGVGAKEHHVFSRILSGNIGSFSQSDIHSSGYVIHTLEASLWCILNSVSYEETVLKAVNLGGDTDTTGAVAGGLAGLLYGWQKIPALWVETLARKNDIEDLVTRLNKKMFPLCPEHL